MAYLTRNEVFALLAEERSRQEEKWGDLDQRNSVGDFLCYIKRYLDYAVRDNHPDLPEDSLMSIKKLTALGVACLERHWKGDE